MPVFLLLAPAALVALAPQSLDQLQDSLKAVPAALILGKPGSMQALVAKAKASWDQASPEIRKAIPEPDAIFIDKQLKAMQKMKPREQAVGALGISSTLSRFQAKSRKQELLQASRAVVGSWCGVDAGQWEPMPNVEAVFKPILDQDRGQHTLAVLGVQDALKRLQESRQKRQAVGAKKALKELLNLVDVLEKP